MGLDMYLTAERHLADYAWKQPEFRAAFHAVIAASKMPYDRDTPSVVVSTTIGYWRKANAIHNWFVNNVQDGVDKCQKADVSREKLQELLDLCKELILQKDPYAVMEKLPPTSGFFFGSSDINEDFWDDLNNTIAILQPVLDDHTLQDCDFYYQSSW